MVCKANPLPSLLGALESRTLYIDQWHTPATDYPEAEVGGYRIHRGRYARGVYRYWGLDGYLIFKVRKPILVTNLQQRRGKHWYGWMIDDPPQQRAMEIYAMHAHGKVLMVGLGLGLYLHELAKNKKVEKITVVEISPEVVLLVEPYLPILPEFTFLLADFFEFIRYDTEQWDTILIDLWVSHSAEDKMEILYHRILPLIPVLAQKYPKAEITFHGFQSVSAVKLVSEEMVNLIIGIGGI